MNGEAIISAPMPHDWSLSDTKMVGSSLLEIQRINFASISDETQISQKEERVWRGVAEKVLTIVVGLLWYLAG